MIWCDNCQRNRQTETDRNSGSLCCTVCAKVIVRDIYSDDLNFTKGSGGEIRTDSTFVRSVGKEYYSQSYQRATYHIKNLGSKLGISDGFAMEQARKFYQIASERNFTRGREIEKVTAACLYIACRANKIPYLLVDFAIELRINVYELGAIYLQLCKVLSLEMHSFVQKLVDPSLFIHRYTSALLKERNMKVSMAALRIVASMKRDWIQTGRKPSGLCGAAVYIAAIAHGFMCRKADIVKVVHVCEATLTKRLVEFGNTESGSLTIDEFNMNAKEFEKESGLKGQDFGGNLGVLCQHKGEKPYCHGLCNACYKEFFELSGGLNGGSDPPAFERAKMERLIKGCENDKQAFLEKFKSDSNAMGDETEDLSDVDDGEVDGYLNNEKEFEYKKLIWEAMNKEYISEQAAKKAAADIGEAMGKSRKKQTHNQATKAKIASAANTAAEATREVLSKKRLSSMVNFDALDKLFEDDVAPNTKRNHIEPFQGGNVKEQEQIREENEGDDLDNDDDREENEGDYLDNDDEPDDDREENEGDYLDNDDESEGERLG